MDNGNRKSSFEFRTEVTNCSKRVLVCKDVVVDIPATVVGKGKKKGG